VQEKNEVGLLGFGAHTPIVLKKPAEVGKCSDYVYLWKIESRCDLSM